MGGTDLDNRMLWIRNIDSLEENDPEIISELEVASEARVVGAIDYECGSVSVRPFTFTRDQSGRLKYLVRVPISPLGDISGMPQASRRGYAFQKGVHGELVTLLALYLSARFFDVAVYRSSPHRDWQKTKTEFRLPARSFSKNLDPILFGDKPRQIDGFDDFLHLVKRLDSSHHQSIILAAHHYHLALHEVGVDDEMVFVRLVSAVEAVSKKMVLPAELDPLAAVTLNDAVDFDQMTPEQSQELRNLFNVRKSQLRFLQFLDVYSKGFFTGGGRRVDRTRIRKRDLRERAKAIYRARSSYLHQGEQMYLSSRFKDGEAWHQDPSAGRTIDNRSYSEKDKLPYPHFFHGLVRYCILRYMEEMSNVDP